MKIIYQVILGIIVAFALSFVIVSFGTVQPVLKQPTLITPVPTPQVVYVTVQPTTPGDQSTTYTEQPQPAQEPTSEPSREASMISWMLPLLIVGVGVMAIVICAITVTR